MRGPERLYLRPAFTKTLAGRLIAGECINLIGPHGQGRRRTLKDLHLTLSDSLRVLQVNLRDYPESLAMLLDALSRQIGCAIAGDLGELLDELEHNSEKTLLILHNFDELQLGQESGYNAHFFAQLNSTCDRENISLLCISEDIPRNLPLQFEKLHLPLLTKELIIAELRRRGMAETELRRTAESLLRQPSPYTAIDARIGTG